MDSAKFHSQRMLKLHSCDLTIRLPHTEGLMKVF